MSYEMPESPKPIFDLELPSELRTQFCALFAEAFELFAQSELLKSVESSTAAARFHRRVKRDIKAHPIFVQTLYKEKFKFSLLQAVCVYTRGKCHDTIKYLIEKNPHALLLPHDRIEKDSLLIHFIAQSPLNYDLLPWIAEHYTWVFQQCQDNPPHSKMTMGGYICSQETVRKFYELYPQGLREKIKADYGRYPLSAILQGSWEPDADFFIWMAKQYPEAVYLDSKPDYTMLHDVCSSLAGTEGHGNSHYTPNMAKICRFLISEHADLIRKSGNAGVLPIHWLVKRCNRPLVQEMIILVLKAHPECIQVKASKHFRELSAVPFIQQVHPLVVKELAVERDMSLFTQVSQNMTKVAVLSTHHIASTSAKENSALTSAFLSSLSEVYRSWADLRIDVLATQKQCLQEHIDEICRRLEGDDVSDETEDEDTDEDDSYDFFRENLYWHRLDYDESEEDTDEDESDGYRANIFGFEEDSDEAEDDVDSNEDLTSDDDDGDTDDDDDGDTDDGSNRDRASKTVNGEEDGDPEETGEENVGNDDSVSRFEADGGRKRKR